MKRLVLLILLIPVIAWGSSLSGAFSAKFGGVEAGGVDCGDVDLTCQNFEGAGFDNSETWDEANIGTSTFDEDYSASPLRGSQSYQVVWDSADDYVRRNVTEQGDGDTFYVFFRMRVDVDVSTGAEIFWITDGASAGGIVQLQGASGVLRATHGSVSDDTTTDVSGGGLFYIWVDWTSETVTQNDGTMNVYVSSTATKPGTAEAIVTTGTADFPGISNIRFYAGVDSTIIYDQVMNSSTDIGSVDEGDTWIKTDTFTEASDTALESHTSDSGGSWSGEDTTNFDIVGADDEVKIDISDTLYAEPTETPSGADYWGSVTGKTGSDSSGDRFGTMVRYTDTTHFYNAWIDGAGNWFLYKNNAGWSQLDTGSIGGFSTATYYTLKLSIVGTDIDLFIEGVNETDEITDSDLSSVGKVMLYISNTNARVTSFQAGY